MPNGILKALTIAIFVAHVAALGLGLWLDLAPLLLPVITGAGALAVLAGLFSDPPQLRNRRLQALAASEAVILAVATAAYARLPALLPFAYAGFALHLVAAGAVMIFALTFRVTRLF